MAAVWDDRLQLYDVIMTSSRLLVNNNSMIIYIVDGGSPMDFYFVI